VDSVTVVANADEVLRLARTSLNLPAPAPGTELLDDELLSALLRRLAGFHCPCSPPTLRAALLDCLDQLVQVTDELSDRIDSVLEALHAGGDLLELARVTTIDEHTRSTWVFAAPPSFVLLPSGMAYVFGLAPEETLPLPDSLRSRVRASGAVRIIEPIAGEDLRADLVNAGFREESIESWLRLPAETTAEKFCRSRDMLLTAAPPSGHIEHLRMYDPSRGERRYADRWVVPTTQTGRYVGRRPQAYGADMWGYVELMAGEPQRFIDFPPPVSAHRGCDEAWRLQLALDYKAGRPQEYRLRPNGTGVVVDLVFPLPLWAQRRLDVVGRRVERHHSLLSYWLSNEVESAEREFLEQRLWLKKAIS